MEKASSNKFPSLYASNKSITAWSFGSSSSTDEDSVNVSDDVSDDISDVISDVVSESLLLEVSS
ncbi:MAG: hypothetical protein WCR63_01425 [Bacilli bacterium]